MATRIYIAVGALTAALAFSSEHGEGAQDPYAAAWQPLLHAVNNYAALQREVKRQMGPPVAPRDGRITLAQLDELARAVLAGAN